MEIHSSSLAYIPASYRSRDNNEQTAPQQKNNSHPLHSLVSPLPTVDKKIDAPTLELATRHIEQTAKVLSNPRTSHAVNAYIQESAQPLKNQRSELISGIDLFV